MQITSFLESDESLLGRTIQDFYEVGSRNLVNWQHSNSPLFNKAIDTVNIDALIITVGRKSFDVPIYEFVQVQSSSITDSLRENLNTGKRFYANDGSGLWILVGRTANNLLKIQSNQSPSQFVELGVATTASVSYVSYSGGLLDHRSISQDGEITVVMVASHASGTPAAPSNVHIAGNRANIASSGGVTWHPAGYYNVSNPGTNNANVWFAVSKFSYNSLLGTFTAGDWILAQARNTVNVQFSSTPTGPWSDYSHNYETETYIRIRRSDGFFEVFPINRSHVPENDRWKFLGQIHIDGSNDLYEPYKTPLFFSFRPSEYRLLKFHWTWTQFIQTRATYTYRESCSFMIDARDISPAPGNTPRPTNTSSDLTGGFPFKIFINRHLGMTVAQSPAPISVASSELLKMQAQFESDDNGSLPITHFRVLRRVNHSSGITGYLRLWLL